ncbi:hypothetical protein ABT186_02170 [Streptomyces sp. NPDC001634]|uniref:hypothetical protein n=1 Tax=Streptomyces sp. NPDC001634 TaxID=3154390 RepID=UPI0033295AA6
MSQSLKLTVNGVNRTAYLEQSTWTISQNWSRQGDTATINLVDEHTGAPTFYVPPLATVTLTDTGINQTLFSGVCTLPQLAYQGPNLNYWQMSCTDWTYLADRALVAGDWSNMTADQLAITFVNQTGAGIIAASIASGGYVQPSPTVPRLQINYQTLTGALTTLSQLVSTADTWGWYIDEGRNLHWFNTSNAPNSGLTFTDSATKLGQSGYVQYDWDNYHYLWDATSIRNRVTVQGAKYSQQQVDTFVGNGSQTSWPLTFTADANNLGNASLKVGGVSKTISAQSGSSASTQWVAVQNSAGAWFLQPNTDPTPGSGTVITLTYTYLAPIVTTIQDSSSVASFASLPNSGVFQYYVNDTSIPTLFTATQRGQRETFTYSRPEERVQLQTTENWGGHVRAGQLITVVNSVTPDSENSYTAGINTRFLVVQNQITGIGGGYRNYQITAARVG